MKTTQVIFSLLADLSQILLIVGLFLTWKQIKIAIVDINTRSKREAGIFAVQQSDRFAKIILPRFDKEISSKLEGNGFEMEEFKMSELSVEGQKKYQKDFSKIQADKELLFSVVNLTNEIESISISFVKGLADEEIIFSSVASAYCSIIERFYFLYCFHRKVSDIGAYPNTIKLYKIWKNRLNKIQLESKKEHLSKQQMEIVKQIDAATINSARITPIGVSK